MAMRRSKLSALGELKYLNGAMGLGAASDEAISRSMNRILWTFTSKQFKKSKEKKEGWEPAKWCCNKLAEIGIGDLENGE